MNSQCSVEGDRLSFSTCELAESATSYNQLAGEPLGILRRQEGGDGGDVGGLAGDDRVRAVLHDYFAWATTTTMAHYHRSADDVPDGLQIPHWSWDGLVRQGGD